MQSSREGRPEKLVVRRGARSGQVITVAVDSTRLGPALGGCRVRAYPTWEQGLADAIRLASAMTEKAALAGLAHGGGKTVVALDETFSPGRRDSRWNDVLADVGDLVEEFGGDYVTGPDVGTGPLDMDVIAGRTAHVLCRSVAAGGSGDSSGPTAVGVEASIEAVCGHLWPDRPLDELAFAVHGLGHVGEQVARYLAARGTRLLVADVDGSRRALADELHAEWRPADEVLRAEVDVLVPCAVGGVITPELVAQMRARAVVGAANNQLDHDDTADLLHARGITWAPDPLVSAGGIVFSTGRERRGLGADRALADVRGIGERLATVLLAASVADESPLHTARRQVARLLDPARVCA